MPKIQKFYLSSDISFHDVMFSSEHNILPSSCKYFQVSVLFKESVRVYIYIYAQNRVQFQDVNYVNDDSARQK